MNHLKQYIKLIKKAKSRELNPETYYEKHHVFPKSLFGENNYLVSLTYKEHIVAHHLLVKMARKRYGNNHRKTIKLEQALHAMVTCHSKYRVKMTDRKIAILIRQVSNKIKYRPTEETKRKISESLKGRTFAPEHLKKISESLKGSSNPRFGKPGFFKGKKHSKSSRQKMSKALSGVNNPNYGKPRSEKTKRKISESNKRTAERKRTENYKRPELDTPKRDWINRNTLEIKYNQRAKDIIEKCNVSKSTYYRIINGEQKYCKRTGWMLHNTKISSDK